MRKLIYYVAQSLDGFIAHADGSWDGFVPEGEHVTDFLASFSWFDTVLMGRKTYEVGLSQGVTSPYPSMDQYVFSRTMESSPDPKVTLVSNGAVPLVQNLKEKSGKGIWVCGGAQLASDLYRSGLIDEIIIKLNPVLLGSGISLFADVVPQTALALTQHKVYDSGVILLHYDVVKGNS